MYTKRKNLIDSINYLSANFPCVALIGARQVGKTTLLKQIFKKSYFFDLEDEKDFTRISADIPLVFQEVPGQIVFDEAQLLPGLFSQLRVEIDKNRQQNGRFIVSGSSSPELLKNITETLAGRVAIIEIPTLSWSEQTQGRYSNFYSSLAQLEKIKNLRPCHDHASLLDLCLKGGYPEPFLKREDNKFYDLWYQNYLKTYIDRDIRILFPNLKMDAYKRLIQMLAFSTGEILNASKFASNLDVSQPTIKNYMNILEGTFIWRRLLSYEKSRAKRVVKMPRGHIRDTGLINFLLNIGTEKQLKGHPHFGRIWESFVIEQILKGLNQDLIQYSAFFYRTNNQTEIDLILEGKFGVIPIEIKSSSSTDVKKLKTLKIFIKENNCPYGIVINNGDKIFMLSEEIIQVPAIFL